jgi:hypothetical protein
MEYCCLSSIACWTLFKSAWVIVLPRILCPCFADLETPVADDGKGPLLFRVTFAVLAATDESQPATAEAALPVGSRLAAIRGPQCICTKRRSLSDMALPSSTIRPPSGCESPGERAVT